MSEAGRRVVSEIVEAGLRPPVRATLAITNGCNLSCAHCWPDSVASSLKQPVRTSSLMTLMEELADLGVEHLCVTGGEPLAHPSCIDILRLACTSFPFREVCLQTNGTLLTEEKISTLAAQSLNSLLVQVSLDGATSATHETVRGPGSFKPAIRALELLASAGFGSRTRVAFTEMRHNFDELPMLLEIAGGMEIGAVVSSTLIKGGRAAHTNRLFPPASSQYRAIVERYLSDGRFKETYEGIGGIAAIEWYKGMCDGAASGCSLIEHPYVTADGRMYPCAMLQAPQYTLHGLYERSIMAALPEALPMWSELLAMSRRRLVALDSCRGCMGLRHCAGGCMGRAFQAHGTAMTREDRCSLRQTVYRMAQKSHP